MLTDDALFGFGLGMPRGEVRLVPHDPRWARCFEIERANILAALPDLGLSIEHVGSTAVPGLCAKPILDLLAWCDDAGAFDRRAPALERLRYLYKGERGVPGRRYLVRHDAAKRVGFVHLHVYARAHDEVRRVLAFRDALRAKPELAREYADLKRALAREHGRDLDRYVELKAAFVAAHST